MRNDDLEQIDLSIEEAQKNIDRMEALVRLRTNKDYKLLIEDGYLFDEAARLVLSKAEPGLQEETHQKMLDKMIDGVGYFRQYLNRIYQFGNQSKRAIEQHRQTREEILEETE